MVRCPQCGYSQDKKQRSSNQNRYYFGVIVDLLSEHTGFTRDEIHEILKHKFLRQTVWIHLKDGIQEQSIIAKSTAKLTTFQFESYLNQIRQWSAESLAVVLPEPNESLTGI